MKSKFTLVAWQSGGGLAIDLPGEFNTLDEAMLEVKRRDALVEVGDPEGMDGCDIEAQQTIDGDTTRWWLDSDEAGNLKWARWE